MLSLTFTYGTLQQLLGGAGRTAQGSLSFGTFANQCSKALPEKWEHSTRLSAPSGAYCSIPSMKVSESTSLSPPPLSDMTVGLLLPFPPPLKGTRGPYMN